MKLGLLEFLCCPRCAGDLSLDPTAEEYGEILEGWLRCSHCGAAYPITAGVPRFVDHPLSDQVISTVDAFAYEWKTLSSLSETDKHELLDYFDGLVTPSSLQGKVILDAGCGMGKFLYLVATNGAAAAIGVDLSESAGISFQNVRHLPNTHVIQADIYRLPLKSRFDFIYSIGVLHHLPRPEDGFSKLAQLLRPGARIFAWVYGYEGNELYIRWFDPFRRLTSRLPRPVARVLALGSAVTLWALIGGVYLPLSRLGARSLPLQDYFLYFYRLGFHCFWGTVLDKMIPSISHYYRRDEFAGWWERSGLDEVVITQRHGNSWRGVGRRRQ